MRRLLAISLLAACTNAAPDPGREHDARFHGWWVVEQPFHAGYEATLYEFRPDGELRVDPGAVMVTGTVANCLPEPPNGRCESDLVCVFGNEWWSTSANHLVIAGDCTDGLVREIAIELSADTSSNSGFGGAGGTLRSVGGETNWSHNDWEWAFRKCVGEPADCPQF